MRMFCKQNFDFVWQDVQLHRTVIKTVLGVMALLMIAAVLPWGSSTIAKWHSLKDFVLLYRYEFFHLPAFLFLLGSTLQTNIWIVLRRYRTRGQIGMHKALLVIVFAGLVSLVVAVVGGLCTAFVKYVVYPNMKHYHAVFLYVPHSDDKSSFLYFLFMYFFVTAIFGLIFVALTDLWTKRFLSVMTVMTLAILDMFTARVIPYVFYISERVSPVWTMIFLALIIMMLINIVRFSSNYKNYYVQDDLL